ncbi:OmpA family protein [Planomonospora sp. ID82291]|uniref:OmpA family protein n=1 Tax=Planomonospora sp. ID82291 TaxID=2738136 RepID=UPI0018C37F9B|nr:OmpA family protein [Planomonospora sp. ID82291]MBG0816167.1 OmpA family protein [Planomonospora sp. ID82291]
MYRSASALAVAAVLLTPAPGPPTPLPVQAGPPVTAPVLDLDAPSSDVRGETLDISQRIATSDGSVTDETSGTERKIVVAADVLFAFDRATLTAKAEKRLAQVAERLAAEAAGERVRIDGHTDAKGDDAYNLALSLRRAQAVRRVLERLLRGRGVTFAVEGHGAADPVAPNVAPDGGDNPEGRARNRRVEIGFPK